MSGISVPLQRYRYLLIGMLLVGGIGALLFSSQVSGQDTRTISVDVVFDQASFTAIPAPGNSPDAAPARGDLLSGQGMVYQHDQRAGDRIGTFYFHGTGMAEPQYFEAAANHMLAVARLELWGEGSLDVMGTINFLGPSYLSIIGGTGTYATATGQCTEIPSEDFDQFTCEIH